MTLNEARQILGDKYHLEHDSKYLYVRSSAPGEAQDILARYRVRQNGRNAQEAQVSRHDRPEYIAPDDIRCEALVKGHRCPRRANQSREGRSVCWQHGAMKCFISWDSKTTGTGTP